MYRAAGNTENGAGGVMKVFLNERKTQLIIRAVVEICHTDNNKIAFCKDRESMLLENPFLSPLLPPK